MLNRSSSLQILANSSEVDCGAKPAGQMILEELGDRSPS
jgi:hypothetical protein